ncbi:SDR family NAD(P)-dependent oxidoreductase [Paenibacillus dendritiformis]|uniref:SDR family NAD(P)-dependent oxidoreductase n=1 Tax=Paenibacillus dendritiformis TaxID=130049 RepID=UPI00143CD5F9|nr:SDR family NAD(P)-dependent oxidoreductase [Paenibacillus dendritiformis]NKI22671.1 SDR family NAD(P)-dependent oxidoreductase [Paenibacillus dendritiformis]NRF98221.1 SDR family NAD(P)-dependent oxidoreductase [Paenibacillus dendritiformis]
MNHLDRPPYKDDDIAVIGIGLQIAGTNNLEEFWGIFEHNIDCIRDLPQGRQDDMEDLAQLYSLMMPNPTGRISYNKAGYLDRIDEFDYEFFKISPIEAQVMDPIQRILLQTIFHAFDDAGYTPDMLNGTKTGIFIGYTPGSTKDNYSTNIFHNNPELIKYSNVGNMPCMVPSRASYILNLKGPTMIIDSACSSSLVAIHDACVSLKNGTCTMAVAGGIRLHSFPIAYDDMNVGFETDDNKTRTFDNAASGAAIGEGSAVVLLKPLKAAEQDKDHIYAVIKGSAINNDGASASITAPNPAAQANVILDALALSGVAVEEIDYIETHGTATALGDPIEFRGLTSAFEKFTDKKQFCGLSSSKSNIGHLYEAAGVASFIKALAAIKYKKIPGASHFNIPNLKIDFCDSPFYISNTTQEWKKDGLRVCGISAFGISGTNCHVIVQEYENQVEHLPAPAINLLGISAKSLDSMITLVHNYKDYLEKTEADASLFAANANLYRAHYAKRAAVMFSNRDHLLAILNRLAAADPSEWADIEGVYYLDQPNESQEMDYTQIRSASKRCNASLKRESDGSLHADFHYLARMYSCGAKLDWSALYQGIEPKHIPLPYYPFKRTRCWLPKKEKKKNWTELASRLQHPKKEEESVPVSSDLFYKRVFVQAGSIVKNHDLGRCLVIHRQEDPVEALRASLQQRFFAVDMIGIDIDEAKRTGIEKYFSQLFGEIPHKDISHLVIADLHGQKESWSAEQLLDRQKAQLLSVASIYREFANYENRLKITPLLNVCFPVTGDEPDVNPNHSSVFGLCKSLNRMFKNMTSCCIDMDDTTDWGKIADEICGMSDKDIVAYRDNQRYYEGLHEAELAADTQRAVIQDDGVYFISGGLGGIGFETAMEMAHRAKDVSLILVGRTRLPEPSEWDAILRAHPESDLAEKIGRLRMLQAKTKQVEYHAVDIADADALQFVLQYIKTKYGKINGVIHGAGISGGITFDQLNEEHLASILMPKVIGTYMLDHFTRDQNLDFFLMFSSISTIFSSADLPGYIAGNIYLDSYSEYRSRACGSKSITVNWATWSEIGMAVKSKFTIDTLFQTIKTKEAIQALFSVLQQGSGSVVVARLNLKDKISMLLKTYPMELSPKIVEALNENAEAGRHRGSSHEAGQREPYGDVEAALIKVCCKNLGYEEMNVHHNFFELGANSILLSIIYKDLNEVFPGVLQVTDLFSYPTISLLAEHISNQMASSVSPSRPEPEAEAAPRISRDTIAVAPVPVEPASVEATLSASAAPGDTALPGAEFPAEFPPVEARTMEQDDGVAIIGVGLDLPACRDLRSYWEVLIHGINAVRDIPPERSADITKHLRARSFSEEQIKFRRCGYLDEVNKFDHAFFGISPRDAALLDPVMRLFLQCCSNAIDDAGYGADGVKGTNTGVFLGYTANIGNAYNRLLYEMDPKLFNDALPIGQVSMTASRAAYVFDLKGPSMVIDTACSSSLVALHMACEQIRFGKCQMALAGGASIMAIPLADGTGIGFESPEEKTRAFADNASGSAIAEGVGVVLLKSLKQAQKDGDSIYAVIKGSAINQDGSSFGIAAPNYLAQSEAIQKAWHNAGVTAHDISYIEAHGTGTQLGDPIEIRGIHNAFEAFTDHKQICGIGSVKTNLGHANEAAGMCGLFKCILALQHKLIPPTLHFQAPNQNIDFIHSPLYVVDKATPLKAKGEKAILGISGFGMSGTNAHIILEEAPKAASRVKTRRKHPFIFTVSARTEKAVFQLIRRYRAYLRENTTVDPMDLACTLNRGRKHYSHRLAFIYYHHHELLAKLTELAQFDSFARIAHDWCRCGHYSIVPESKQEKYPHEITSKEQQKLSDEANAYCATADKHNAAQLQLIIDCYIKGATVRWSALYNEPFQKLHLPTYPYARNHAWYPIPVKETPAPRENTIYDHFFHHKRWVVQEGSTVTWPPEEETYVLVHGKSDGPPLLARALREKGVRVIEVFACHDGFAKVDQDTYRIGNNADDFKELFVQLSDIPFRKIVHAGAYRDEEASRVHDIYEELEHGFFNVVHLVKGLVKARLDQPVQLVLVACNAYRISGGEQRLLPHHATVLSLGKVIEQEIPNISCRAIDADMETDVKQIIGQLFADHQMYLIGLRQDKSYVEEFDEAEMQPETANRIVDGGTYIITGGTSGIGIQNAKLFSEQANCHLILLSRKGFPDESVWEAYETKEGYREQIKEFRQIKKNGSTLEFIACDVSKADDVQAMLESVRSKYKKINGIAHCAGVIEPSFMLRKEKESYLSVFAPKIAGTWNLANFTQQDHLDFMLLHSSNVTDAGEPGQSCYMAANAFLDAFTDYLNAQGRNTYTVNWVAWKETGMAHKQGTNVDTVTKAITNREAANALNELLRSKPQRAVIGQFNEKVDLVPLLKSSRNAVAPSFTAKVYKEAYKKQIGDAAPPIINESAPSRAVQEANPAAPSGKQIKLTGKLEGIYTPVEKQIGKIYCDILGYEEADIYEGFFEMGGDSILLTEMHDTIDKLYPNIVKIADLFEFDSIYSLSEYITPRIQSDEAVESVEMAEAANIRLKGNVEGVYTPVEKQIGQVYGEILGYDEVDIYEGFFEMGGDSILLTEMHDTINKLYPNIVKIADLFEFDSIQSLSEYISSRMARMDSAEKNKGKEAAVQNPKEQTDMVYYDMSGPQERIYFDYRLSSHKNVYNIGFVSDKSGDDYEDLAANVNKFVEQFDMLRTTFTTVNNKLVQCVNPMKPIEIQRVQVDSADDIDFAKHVKTFKLSEYPLFHLTLFEAPDKKLLFFDIHHILLDGYSTTLLQEQMEVFGKLDAKEKPLCPYSKYVEFEKTFYAGKEYAEMEDYWKHELHGFDFTNPLERKEAKDTSYGHASVQVSSGLARALLEFAKSRNTTMFTIFLSAYALALRMFTKRSDISIVTPMLNRYEPEFRNCIGVFTNLIPLRVEMKPQLTLDEHIKHVTTKTIGGIKNQFYQYNHIIRDFKEAGAQFHFYMDFEDNSLKRFRETEDIPYAVHIPKFILDLEVKNLNQMYHISASYKKSYLSDEEVTDILHSLMKNLSEIFTNAKLHYTLDEFIEQFKGGEVQTGSV